MKTQVIQLDSQDDVTSVRDKMSWAKAERILLVFPTRPHILRRSLDMHLIQRHANTLGLQLAIVVQSDEQRQVAAGLNIPAFGTAASARRQDWERKATPDSSTAMPKASSHRIHARPDLRKMRSEAFPPEAGWRSIYSLRFVFFSLGVLAILAVLSLFIPSASIKLTPETRLQDLTFTISASPELETVNLAGSLPARLTSIVIEHSNSIPATGSVSIPDARAGGTVRFRNLTTTLVGIPAGTVVSTHAGPPIRFSTTLDAVVAAGAGKTVDVPVQAVEAGSAGNLPADALIAFEDVNLGTSLAVTNPDPTAGGSDRIAAIQTADDRALVHEALLAEILDECKVELPQTLASGDTYFPGTTTVSQILSENYFPSQNQSGDTLSLTMRSKCEAQYASAEDVSALVGMSLDANLADGFTPVSDGLTVKPARVPHTDVDGITRWEVEAQRLLQARLDPLTAVQLSLGRKPTNASQKLENNLPLSGEPTITITPGWWPWMPLIPFRITISIHN